MAFVIKIPLEDNVFRCFYHVENSQHPESPGYFQAAQRPTSHQRSPWVGHSSWHAVHLRDAGELDQIGRGLYRLADLPPLSNPDLVVVARKIPQAVICLISALAFHELTLQIPHVVDIALASHTERSILKQPPIRVYWYSGLAFTEGVEVHQIDAVSVKIYGPEKSLADAFKYRNKIGLDVALEALKFFRQRPTFNADKLLHYARICRVEKIMRPYLEALA
jgi:predicted transcriptional regulator of viral defense system